MILQRAGGTHFIADAVAQSANGIFWCLFLTSRMWTTPISTNACWRLIEQIGSYSKQIRSAIEDGVVEPTRRQQLTTSCTSQIPKLQEHAALVYKIFCISEKTTPASVQLRAPWRVVTVEERTHDSLTTHYRRSQLIALPVPGGKAKVEYCYAVNVPGDRGIEPTALQSGLWVISTGQKETVLCDKLTAGSTLCLRSARQSHSLGAGTQRVTDLREGYEHNASARSNSLFVNSGK